MAENTGPTRRAMIAELARLERNHQSLVALIEKIACTMPSEPVVLDLRGRLSADRTILAAARKMLKP